MVSGKHTDHKEAISAGTPQYKECLGSMRHWKKVEEKLRKKKKKKKRRKKAKVKKKIVKPL